MNTWEIACGKCQCGAKLLLIEREPVCPCCQRTWLQGEMKHSAESQAYYEQRLRRNVKESLEYIAAYNGMLIARAEMERLRSASIAMRDYLLKKNPGEFGWPDDIYIPWVDAIRFGEPKPEPSPAG